jgi:hypothetical protein
MHISLWVQVTHSSFIEGSHMTKNMSTGVTYACDVTSLPQRRPLWWALTLLSNIRLGWKGLQVDKHSSLINDSVADEEEKKLNEIETRR